MSAYNAEPVSRSSQMDSASLGLPIVHTYKNQQYQLDLANETDFNALLKIFEDVVEEGQTYPQESINADQFKAYFYSHYTFAVRLEGEAVAGFYIKPNFPGRSSHLANYGLIVHRDHRGKGIGNFMITNCIQLARLVGFKALYTNLVYVTNPASIKTCHNNGFQQVGRVPKAGLLKGYGYVDALQFYKDLTEEN